jgi:hypothetical protein
MRSPVSKLLVVGFVASVFQLGCSGRGARSGEGGVVVEKDTEIVHEECDVASDSSERLDANADGKADVTIVKIGNRELCRALDLNFDGVADTWIYLADNGLDVRRRERDYDRDGRIDEIAIFEKGQLVEKRLATLMTNKLDTWEHYHQGRLASTERDSDGDNLVDQWWDYRKPGCPLIHADANRDGRPDPEISVDYCKETGYVPPDRMDARPVGPTFEPSAPGSRSDSATQSDAGSANAKAVDPPPAPPAAPPASPASGSGGATSSAPGAQAGKAP